MQIWVSEENLPFFEALSSPVRIKILEHLAHGEANIKDLAKAVGVTSAMMTAHINKLEAAADSFHPYKKSRKSLFTG